MYENTCQNFFKFAIFNTQILLLIYNANSNKWYKKLLLFRKFYLITDLHESQITFPEIILLNYILPRNFLVQLVLLPFYHVIFKENNDINYVYY